MLIQRRWGKGGRRRSGVGRGRRRLGKLQESSVLHCEECERTWPQKELKERRKKDNSSRGRVDSPLGKNQPIKSLGYLHSSSRSTRMAQVDYNKFKV